MLAVALPSFCGHDHPTKSTTSERTIFVARAVQTLTCEVQYLARRMQLEQLPAVVSAASHPILAFRHGSQLVNCLRLVMMSAIVRDID